MTKQQQLTADWVSPQEAAEYLGVTKPDRARLVFRWQARSEQARLSHK